MKAVPVEDPFVVEEEEANCNLSTVKPWRAAQEEKERGDKVLKGNRLEEYRTTVGGMLEEIGRRVD